MTDASGFITLVPVNRLDKAKGRLDGLLTPEERAQLAIITTRTVVEAAAQVGPVAVLTADPHVRDLFASSAQVLDEDAALRGLNPQLESALDRLSQVESVLILHADLPLATPDLILDVSAPAGAGSVAIVRPPDGGTNAMLVNPNARFPLAYGTESCGKHIAAAEAAGLQVVVVPSPHLEVDLDTPDDIAALLGTEQGRACAAGRYLLEINVEARLGRET